MLIIHIISGFKIIYFINIKLSIITIKFYCFDCFHFTAQKSKYFTKFLVNFIILRFINLFFQNYYSCLQITIFFIDIVLLQLNLIGLCFIMRTILIIIILFFNKIFVFVLMIIFVDEVTNLFKLYNLNNSQYYLITNS